MHKILLVEKYSISSPFWAYLLKNKAVSNSSIEEIIEKYHGFEGELIYMTLDNNNKQELDAMIDLLDKSNNYENYSLIHVVSNFFSEPLFENIEGTKCGYDIGICEYEKTIYSSIFNEVLFGHLPELINFYEFLNESLLFPERKLAEKYINVHKQLSIQGKGVEDYEDMQIYEIWKGNLLL